MLSDQERDYIFENISSCEHDYFVWSTILGEPYVNDDFICYFDGVSLAISGVPLSNKNTMQTVPKRIEQVINEWMLKPNVHFVNYFGPHELLINNENGFDLIYKHEPLDYNFDLFIDINTWPDIRLRRKIKRDVNHAIRSGVEVEWRKQEFLTADQLELISNLAHRKELEISDVSYLTNAVVLLKHPSSLIFEASIDNKVEGIIITHNYFSRNPFLILAAFNRQHSGISDALYSKVISYYRAQGAASLGLGYAASSGQFNYKKKWGGKSFNPACWQFIWKRRNVPLVFRDSLHWPWRLLSDKWCSLPIILPKL